MQTNRQYDTVAAAIRWMTEHRDQQPDLDSLADAIGVSPHHLQRTFTRWAGVSPKQFLKHLTRTAALERLAEGCSVLDAALSVGLSGPGRLHDLLISTEAVTPGEARTLGSGVRFGFGSGDTPFGGAVTAWSPRGLSFLGFCGDSGPASCIEALREQWPRASFQEDSITAQGWLDQIFAGSRREPLRIWLSGTPFRLKVWQALLSIPPGALATYGSLARLLGQAGAARAIGSAVGANPLAWIIPCHRVIRESGEFGGYRWGATAKQAMIGLEAARATRAGLAP